MTIDLEKEREAARLRGSLLEFTKFFYLHITGREFIVSKPPGRESHQITVCKAYTQLFRQQKEAHGLLINVPPGYGKSVLTSMFVAWSFAHYPDCNFLYISYSHDLASRHTAFIKQIMSSSMYRYLFDIEISSDSRAKDKFSTTAGGTVNAFGSAGAITGTNAGLPGQDRFSGAVIIDDAHKPDEIHSTTMRETVIRDYQETILQRPRDARVPIVFIGQRLHENDLAAYLMSGKDIRAWETVILKGIDDAGNALYPEAQPLSYLLELKEKSPFVFSSQIQQEPIPAGGALFKTENFVILDDEPNILVTFITADTASSSKDYADATSFSFWGLYKLDDDETLSLHCLDNWEIRCEPKDLQSEFMSFYADCMRHRVKPRFAAIEKASTGITLLSVLQDMRGLEIREVKRTKASGSKTARFLEMQPYVASKLISFTAGAKHVDRCISHMIKITANASHAHDDICDNFYDACKIALIDKLIYLGDDKAATKAIAQSMARDFNRKLKVIANSRTGSKW